MNGTGSWHNVFRLMDYLRGFAKGTRRGSMLVKSGAVKASGTVTFTSTGPVNDETMVVAGQTITAKTSATPGELEFTRSNTPSVDATNLAALLNSHTAFAGVVTASAASGVVTIKAAVPGLIGNTLTLTESMTNTAVSGSGTLASGTDGTAYNLTLGQVIA
jgi:hypothetical protein